MMIGNNRLLLNKATIMNAVQMWLDSVYAPPVYVKDVNQGSDDVFEVKVSDDKTDNSNTP